jgi:cellulose synthase/poly-beta-1,6-N-acetylglucosamine synthase-like glycosyltransferase
MLSDAIGVVSELLRERPLAMAALVLILELPRYTFSFLVLALFGLRNTAAQDGPGLRVSLIVTVYNGADNIADTLASVFRQEDRFHEIIVVNDASTDGTAEVLADIRQRHPRLKLLHHRQRTGKSAAVNHAARFATGELLLNIDADTILGEDAVARLSAVFADERLAAASGNIIASNAGRNAVTALQSLEYLLSITVGKTFIGYIGSVTCCSGAFSMFRRSAFMAVGGLNVGPGEDLEITLRLRKAGYDVTFVREAVCATAVPGTLRGLLRQRLRWDRDALCIRIFMYGQLSFRFSRERFADTLQRMDFIFLDLLPTLVFPAYLLHLALTYPEDFWMLLQGLYVALFFFYALNIALAMIALRRLPGLVHLLVLPVLPLYQGLVMRLWRFYAFTQEILFSGSRDDDYVPRRVRAAVYGGPR